MSRAHVSSELIPHMLGSFSSDAEAIQHLQKKGWIPGRPGTTDKRSTARVAGLLYRNKKTEQIRMLDARGHWHNITDLGIERVLEAVGVLQETVLRLQKDIEILKKRLRLEKPTEVEPLPGPRTSSLQPQ